MESLDHFELTKEFLERFGEAIESKNDSFIKESLDRVNPADITSLLHEFSSEKSKYVLDLLKLETAAEIINDLDADVRSKFLQHFTPVEISRFINELDSDDGADIINELPIKIREEVIEGIENEEKAANVLELLRYDEDCAGGLMAKELIKANANWSIGKTIEEIRRQAEDVQKVYAVYVVDDFGRLLGRVSLKKIVMAEDHTKVSSIYDSDVISVETYRGEEEVADIMRKYDLEALPVVNRQGRLVGRITIDDIVDVITELAEQERQLMAGISEDVEEDDSVLMLTRARLPWLVVGMLGGLLGAVFMEAFEHNITLSLTFFIPLIMATGGNVGIQSSSLVVQSLANKSGFSKTTYTRLWKVFWVAILNGFLLAAMVFLGVQFLMGSGLRLALIVAIALLCVVLLSSFMGTATPLILDRFGINPALASGPFITTANDLLGLAVYFGVAHLLFSM
ncbi:MAG: magnesium transporter MgtE [Cyclobacteriaceae bacterium]|nr:MAG: magnesium transporter MgtE [Cyclobacteriaceae bacterium]